MSEVEDAATPKRRRAWPWLLLLGTLLLCCCCGAGLGASGLTYYKTMWRRGAPPPAELDGETDPGYRLLAEAVGAKRDVESSCAERSTWLLGRLASGTADEALAFDAFLRARIAEANTPELRTLCELSRAPCDDDRFEDFRAFLVLQGRAALESARRDPDSVTSWLPLRPVCNGLLSIAPEAYRRITSQEPPEPPPLPEGVAPLPPGERDRRLPRACARYTCGALDTFDLDFD